MELGPNVKKLMIIKTSLTAIPKGGNLTDGINFLSNKQLIIKTMKESCDWVETAIRMVRQAGEPNPFKDKSDEDIAGEILRKLEEKKKKV
jgi:hypothetical protein